MGRRECDTRVRVLVPVLQPRGPITIPKVLIVSFSQGIIAANTALFISTMVTIIYLECITVVIT